MISDKISNLEGHKYINLETYKKSGQAVRTPVWFVISENQIFVTTRPDTGKVKRIRNNPKVKVMPCGMKGEPKGDWIEGTARFANEIESQNAVNLRNKKYGFKAKLVGAFAYRGIKPVVIAIAV
ncbi:MAG: PPOX class F420-dependent oxidoreductase [Thermoproteota archaeon]|jgi:PPOX class probable F420-dependent enzyme|nr:PPOX class F420-dependent oxidoreductase [Candidatus Nitrosotenuis sp.]